MIPYLLVIVGYDVTNLALHQDVLHISCRFCSAHCYMFQQLDSASNTHCVHAPYKLCTGAHCWHVYIGCFGRSQIPVNSSSFLYL